MGDGCTTSKFTKIIELLKTSEWVNFIVCKLYINIVLLNLKVGLEVRRPDYLYPIREAMENTRELNNGILLDIHFIGLLFCSFLLALALVHAVPSAQNALHPLLN